MEKRKFKIGDEVVTLFGGIETKGTIISISAEEARPPYLISFGSDAIWYNENELKPYESSGKSSEQKEELKKHKGCDFANGDFYRSFTKKNGSVVFNKVKVSTLCICKDGQGVRIATINSDERLQASKKVRLEDGAMMDVVCCVKVMDKYIQDLVKGIAETNDLCDEEVYKITGIYKEKEVTKTVTETELVLEEI